MKLPSLRSLRNIAYLLLMVTAVVLVAIWWPVLVRIWREQSLTFLGAVLVMICATFVQARNFLTFLDVEHRVRLWHFAPVWALSALANYVAPLQPGIAVRVVWLSRRGVSVPEGLLATWRQLVVSVWIALIGLVGGLMLTGDPRGRWPALALGVVWLAMFALRKLWLKWLDRLARPAWLVQRKQLLHRAATGIRLSGLAGVVVQYALGTLLLYWVYTRFGAAIGVGQALILTCLVYVSSMLALLPGNLGIMEAIYMLGGHGFGLSVATSGALAILVRVAHVVANVIVALAGVRFARGVRSKRA
ncbi:MAG TPA: lysylphosphatidylglycerol synthase domain-containing protein [Rhodanobacteraceae bacterium]|nr:lysylphosphatidylglycerol synthase domain-containing protein [Rhodanobacteraceae bacterium]